VLSVPPLLQSDAIPPRAQELIDWIRTHGRKPLQILNPLTPEQHEERRLGKAFSKLRTQASTGSLNAAIGSELDKVG
jgi:hypothetical protein